MLKAGMTIREAAEQWVREFDAIQTDMIKKLMKYEPEEWGEVTKGAVGDRAYVYDECASGEIVKRNSETFESCIKLDRSGRKVWVKPGDFELEYDERLPMWGTMWSFHDPCDIHWLEEGDGIEVMSRCGFRVYESEEFGFFFGIDAAGFDFYEAYWIPLYKARGLQWHDPKTEVAA
ncbi:MAG: hypothetical protein IJ741_07080 [Schwartzia sp.]|nr:hypothetical protein [Schwartzia sp. (in: firmicutes)]